MAEGCRCSCWLSQRGWVGGRTPQGGIYRQVPAEVHCNSPETIQSNFPLPLFKHVIAEKVDFNEASLVALAQK